MRKKAKTRRDYLTIQAINPDDGKNYPVLLSHNRIQAVARRSLGHAKECAYIVPMILQRPTAVFEGLMRDDDDDRRGCGWRCYCGVPEKAYRENGDEVPTWPGFVYLVFINDERVAYNWRWEECDPDKPRLPLNHVPVRFRRRLL